MYGRQPDCHGPAVRLGATAPRSRRLSDRHADQARRRNLPGQRFLRSLLCHFPTPSPTPTGPLIFTPRKMTRRASTISNPPACSPTIPTSTIPTTPPMAPAPILFEWTAPTSTPATRITQDALSCNRAVPKTSFRCWICGRPLAACRRHDSIVPKILDHLSVVVHRVRAIENCDCRRRP
jgi:hypothetical protein